MHLTGYTIEKSIDNCPQHLKYCTNKFWLLCLVYTGQGHREFPFGNNSREFAVRKIPAGIPGNFYELTFLH